MTQFPIRDYWQNIYDMIYEKGSLLKLYKTNLHTNSCYVCTTVHGTASMF